MAEFIRWSIMVCDSYWVPLALPVLLDFLEQAIAVRPDLAINHGLSVNALENPCSKRHRKHWRSQWHTLLKHYFSVPEILATRSVQK
jgi:hypothetical protein